MTASFAALKATCRYDHTERWFEHFNAVLNLGVIPTLAIAIGFVPLPVTVGAIIM